MEPDGYRYRVTHISRSREYDVRTGKWEMTGSPETQNETFTSLDQIRRWVSVLEEIGIFIEVTRVERQPINPVWEQLQWP